MKTKTFAGMSTLFLALATSTAYSGTFSVHSATLIKSDTTNASSSIETSHPFTLSYNVSAQIGPYYGPSSVIDSSIETSAPRVIWVIRWTGNPGETAPLQVTGKIETLKKAYVEADSPPIYGAEAHNVKTSIFGPGLLGTAELPIPGSPTSYHTWWWNGTGGAVWEKGPDLTVETTLFTHVSGNTYEARVEQTMPPLSLFMSIIRDFGPFPTNPSFPSLSGGYGNVKARITEMGGQIVAPDL